MANTTRGPAYSRPLPLTISTRLHERSPSHATHARMPSGIAQKHTTEPAGQLKPAYRTVEPRKPTMPPSSRSPAATNQARDNPRRRPTTLSNPCHVPMPPLRVGRARSKFAALLLMLCPTAARRDASLGLQPPFEERMRHPTSDRRPRTTIAFSVTSMTYETTPDNIEYACIHLPADATRVV